MQVHAVPDAERATDSQGRKLPWGYEYADLEPNQRRVPEERGPFGKARKRGTSRAKTPTTKTAEDEAKLHNQRVQDLIFGSVKLDEDKKRSVSGGRPPTGPASTQPSSGQTLTETGAPFPAGATTAASMREPTEVVLYGFGSDVQWAAIDYFEKISSGVIYEEYDRDPFNQKFNYAFTSNHASHRLHLSRDALVRINQYLGGNHWIKVTFDSADAAERACHYSPRVLQGYNVHAEPYRGTPPTGGDREIRAAVGMGSISSLTASPGTVWSGITNTTGTGASQTSTTTASSATVTASAPALSNPFARDPLPRPAAGAFPTDLYAPRSQQLQGLTSASSTATATTSHLGPTSRRATLRLKGKNVKPAEFLPQEKAFLPVAPRWQQTVGALPVIGWMVGSGQDQVPRKDDGSFDLQNASLYWRAWYAVDACFGSDFCGVRDAEYDD